MLLWRRGNSNGTLPHAVGTTTGRATLLFAGGRDSNGQGRAGNAARMRELSSRNPGAVPVNPPEFDFEDPELPNTR